MTRFKTFLNFREESPRGETNTLPSLTQPDEVLTIRQMLERHVRGLPMSSSPQGGYLPPGLDDIPDIRTLDLTEIQDYAESWRQRKQEIEDHHKQQREQSEQEARAKAEQADPSEGQTE